MAHLKDKAAELLGQVVISGLFLTPALVGIKYLVPISIPWAMVLIPWIGVIHLVLCWFAARTIALMFLNLVQPGDRL
jgi:hypothetical protein